MLFPLLLILFLIWSAFTIFRVCRVRRMSSGIYSPPAPLLLGHLYMIPKCRYEWINFLIENANRAVQNGHTTVRWWVLHKLSIWVLDAETYKVILENSVELRKGRDYAFYSQWLGEGLLLSDGAKWRRQRRMLTPTFHFGMLEQYIGVFNRNARILVEKLSKLAENQAEEQHDISHLMIRCSLDIVAEAIMGVHLDTNKEECRQYMDAVKEFNDLAHVYTTNPLFTIVPFIWLLSGRAMQTRRCVQRLKQFTRKVIEDRIKLKEQNSSSTRNDDGMPRRGKAFLDLLLEMEDKLDKEELREQMDTFTFEGHDTSAHALIWSIWCLATHPQCQQQVHAELVAQLDHDDDECRELGVAELNELRFLDRCLKEALRMFPPVPVLERDLQNDVRIGGKTAPRGAMVLISPIIAHHNEKVYPRHWEFNPDNFLPEAIARRNSYDYIPFSAGPRNCIGQKFALLEVKILLAHIFRHFRLSTDVPFRANRPAMEAILRPEFGLPVRIHRIQSSG